MAWLKVDQNLPEHPKTIHLRALRGHKNTDQTAGFMVRVWGWALDNKPDGMIGEVDPSVFGEALRVKDGAELIEQLRTTGFVCTERCLERGLDPVAHRDGRIHDWDHMSGELASQRSRDAERKRLVRSHERGEHVPPGTREGPERPGHATGPVAGCPKCDRASSGRPADKAQNTPIDRDEPAGVPAWGRPLSDRRPPDNGRTSDRTSAPTRARAHARGRQEGEGEEDKRPPTPTAVAGRTGTEALEPTAARQMRELLESVTDARWRDALQRLLLLDDPKTTSSNVCTWFRGTTLEEQDGFMVVRGPNAFTVEWLASKGYRALIAKVLEVPAARVVIALAGQKVELEPEPVEEES